MAYSYIWPVGLPQRPNTNYTETGGVLIIRSSMDAGPAKQRRRGARPQGLSLSFDMSDAQVAILDTFVKITISGIARFGFTHPRTGVIVEVRIVPSGDGQLYSLAYNGPNHWVVSMSMEVLP